MSNILFWLRAIFRWAKMLPDRLARMLREGGPLVTEIGGRNSNLRLRLPRTAEARFVLFGFRPRRASHPERSASKQSDGYASSADHSTCFAHHALNSEPFMQHAGESSDAFQTSEAS